MAISHGNTEQSQPPGQRSFVTTVVSNVPVNEQHRLLTLAQPSGSPEPGPGQFHMISTGSSIEPLLKRPFCFFRRTSEGIQLLYKVVGKGTRALAEITAGATIEVVGPLGNSYPRPARGTKPIVVTGGIGMASVFPFIEAHKGKCTVIYGARTAGELMFTDELSVSATELHVCTDDGTSGTKGTVIDVLRQLSPDKDTRLYVCGPKPMIQAVTAYAKEHAMDGWASLEEYMACGIGACMGCVTQTTKGYRRVCKEGPVFKLSELIT